VRRVSISDLRFLESPWRFGLRTGVHHLQLLGITTQLGVSVTSHLGTFLGYVNSSLLHILESDFDW